MTKSGIKKIGDVGEGEEVMCKNIQTGKYEAFTVWDKLKKQTGSKKCTI